MKFKINGKTWEIILHNTKRMRELIKEITGEDYDFAYGYTYYPSQKILLNKDITFEQQLFTLKHELTHCFIWNSGLYHVDYTNEIVCDIVASSNDFINEIVEKFRKVIE